MSELMRLIEEADDRERYLWILDFNDRGLSKVRQTRTVERLRTITAHARLCLSDPDRLSRETVLNEIKALDESDPDLKLIKEALQQLDEVGENHLPSLIATTVGQAGGFSIAYAMGFANPYSSPIMLLGLILGHIVLDIKDERRDDKVAFDASDLAAQYEARARSSNPAEYDSVYLEVRLWQEAHLRLLIQSKGRRIAGPDEEHPYDRLYEEN